MLEEIVRTDQKQRYSFNGDRTLIRANPGHSIPVDVELDTAKPPEFLWPRHRREVLSFYRKDRSDSQKQAVRAYFQRY